MSDLTWADVRIACEHGRFESHPLPEATPTALLGLAGAAYIESDLCRPHDATDDEWVQIGVDRGLLTKEVEFVSHLRPPERVERFVTEWTSSKETP